MTSLNTIKYLIIANSALIFVFILLILWNLNVLKDVLEILQQTLILWREEMKKEIVKREGDE